MVDFDGSVLLFHLVHKFRRSSNNKDLDTEKKV